MLGIMFGMLRIIIMLMAVPGAVPGLSDYYIESPSRSTKSRPNSSRLEPASRIRTTGIIRPRSISGKRPKRM